MITINRDEIARLTEEYGGAWGINHTRRLLNLVAIIGEGQQYDADAVWVAAHLHDWGAYKKWAVENVEHDVRSVQVAGDFLKEQGYPEDFAGRVLECIEFHHGCDTTRSIEAQLLYDADVLDFLGVVGALRDFSKNSRDLRKGYETTKKRRAKLPGTLLFDKSKAMAVTRIKQMDDLYAAFEENTFGCF